MLSLLYHFCSPDFGYFKYKLAKYAMQRNKLKVDKRFEYNAFLSYSSSDEAWVIHQLVEKLEKEDQFRLCLHERDFQIGQPIADNIVLGLEQSSSCILILTEKFTESYWCNFEACVAHHMFQEQGRMDNLVNLYNYVAYTYCLSKFFL